MWKNQILFVLLAIVATESKDFEKDAHIRAKRQIPPPSRDLHGYQQSATRPGEISINFINKSGRRIRMFKSDPYGHEIRYQFLLRPNEPQRVLVQADNSFWVAYDVKTSFLMLINRQHRMETYYLRYGQNIDAIITSRQLRPEAIKKDRGTPRFVETQVIVDPSMILHHGENEVMNYTLALMNMVARTFLHRTFGAPVYIAVVDVHLMTDKPSYYRIVPNRPEISVASGCRYAKNLVQKNDSVDFSLVLTREDIGPAGFASMYTMCSKRSCALVKENGPDSAFVIAHELAHALGIDHDESSNCQRDNLSGGNLMVKKLYSTSSNYQWSKCSRGMIWQNLKYFECLENKPKMLPAFKKSMDSLPGELLNRTIQCQHYHGSAARACNARNPAVACRYLWCHPNPLSPCQPVWWHSPLEGSMCAKEKWCLRGKCIKKVKIIAVDGGWSKYSEFTPKCDIQTESWLVQESNRSCTNPKPRLSGKKCKGNSKQYRVLLPTGNGICKPYSLRNLMLNGKMSLDSLLEDGCAKKNTNMTKWRVYRDSEQKRQVQSMNLTCDFESRGCQWTSSSKGVKGWNIGRGRTPTRNTGPSFDHTYRNASGSFLYFEASWVSGKNQPLRDGSRVVLESPLVMASSVCLRFAYHMYGRSINRLDVFIRRGKHFRKVWTKKGAQGNKWFTTEIDLSINIEYKVTIEAVRGSSYYSDIAIDDISLTYGLCGSQSKKDDKPSCTTVCINQDNSAMIRKKLPDGYPCKLPNSKNNVCFKKVCQPVNCHGVIKGRKC